MKLTFLGTGTSTGVPIPACHCLVCASTDPRDKRTRPSVLMEYDRRAVLIDTTPDFRYQALREGMERLDAVVFTGGVGENSAGVRGMAVPDFVARLREHEVLVGPGRMVTHYGITRDDVDTAVEAARQVLAAPGVATAR